MEHCQVCLISCHPYHHFGAHVCGACSAFFRRAIAERKSYTCRKSNRCDVKTTSRKSCPACRMQRCYDIGMKMKDKDQNANSTGQQSQIPQSTIDSNPYAIHQIPIAIVQPNPATIVPTIQAPIPGTSTNVIVINKDVHSMPCKIITNSELCQQYPTIYNLVCAIRTFSNAQRSIIMLEVPHDRKRGENYVYLKKSDYDKLEQSCISLIYSMLGDFFEPFSTFTQEQKVEVLKNLAFKINILEKSHLNANNFPGVDENRLMPYQGCIIDLNDLDYFCSEHPELDPFRPLLTMMLKYWKGLCNKFVKNQVSEIDIASLAYVIFTRECEKLSIFNPIMDEKRKTVFKELHDYYCKTFRLEDSVVKYSNLLCLINDIMEFHCNWHEYFMMAKILNPSLLYVWEDYVKL